MKVSASAVLKEQLAVQQIEVVATLKEPRVAKEVVERLGQELEDRHVHPK